MLNESQNMYYNKESNLIFTAQLQAAIHGCCRSWLINRKMLFIVASKCNSFDTVFSAKAADGNPEPICNAAKGVINKQTL